MNAAEHLGPEPSAGILNFRLHFYCSCLRIDGICNPRDVPFKCLAGIGYQRDSDFLLKLNETDVALGDIRGNPNRDRKSTRLNSSHLVISYAVFCLKKKKKKHTNIHKILMLEH